MAILLWSIAALFYGQALAKERQLKSIAAYNQAISADPKNYQAFYERGLVYFADGKYDNAIKDFNEALRLKPDFSAACAASGRAFLKKGDNVRALKDMRLALRSLHDDASLWEDIALVNLKLKDYSSAIDAATQSLWENSRSYNSRMYRARALLARNETKRALEDASVAISVDNSRPEALVTRGDVYAQMGDYQSAVNDFTQAIEMHREDPSVLKKRGMGYVALNNLGAAIGDWEEAARLDPKDAGLMFDIGDALDKTGNLDEAVKYYRNAVKLGNSRARAVLENRGLDVNEPQYWR